MIELAIYRGATATEPKTFELKRFEDLARRLRRPPVRVEDKKRAPLLSRGAPGSPRPGRKRPSTLAPCQVIVDVDGSGVPPAEASARMTAAEIPHSISTTHSHGDPEKVDPEKPGPWRYRIWTGLIAEGPRSLEASVRRVAAAAGIEPEAVDPGSWEIGRHFYTPSVHPDRAGAYEHHEWIGDGEWTFLPEPAARPGEHLDAASSDSPPPALWEGDFDELVEAAWAIPAELQMEQPGRRDHWLKIGMCFHFTGHEKAEEAWDEWSRRAEGSYDPEDQRSTWRNFRRDGKRTPATIFGLAREHGWRPERERAAAPPDQDFAELLDAGTPPAESEPARAGPLEELNERYAYVILKNTGAVADLRRLGRFISTKTFLDYKGNLLVRNPRRGARQPDRLPLGKAWMTWPLRRSFGGGADFLPDGGTDRLSAEVLNLWRGWGTQPAGGEADCEHWLAHVREVVCSGDEKLYHWVLAWCAHLVQRPWEKPGTCLVLKGDEGVGKGAVAQMLLRIAGEAHGIHVTQPSHLTGHFNSHLGQALLVFADEVTWGGNRQAAEVLKGLITEPTFMMEPKGVDAFPVRSFHRIVISSNSEWVIPAGRTSRRYQVLEVRDDRKNDRAYFDAIFREIKGAGPAGLLAHLRGLDLESGDYPDPRTFIKTDALREQKEQSLRPDEAWLLECLREGAISPAQDGWPEAVKSEELRESIRSRVGNVHLRNPATMALKILRRVFGEVPRTRGREGKVLFWQYDLPPLKRARELWDAYANQPFEWDEEVEPDQADANKLNGARRHPRRPNRPKKLDGEGRGMLQ